VTALVVVAHEAEPIRSAARHVIEEAGWQVVDVGDGREALAALDPPPAALVLDVAVGGVLAYEVVEEVRRRQLPTRVVLIASVYNRTSYKRRPTSLYGADDYVEQHHIPDALVPKLERLIGAAPHAGGGRHLAHADTPEGRAIRDAGEGRLAPLDAAVAPELRDRAERLARLIVSDIALYNGDALDAAAAAGDLTPEHLETRLRADLDEGRLLFDLRVPLEVRRGRDFIGEALKELLERRGRARKEAAGG
jgi:CheY-like chemotaxis protein